MYHPSTHAAAYRRVCSNGSRMCRVTEGLNDRRASADSVPDRKALRQIKRDVLERDPHAAAAYRCVYRNGIRLSRVTEGSNDGSTLADTVSDRNV